MADVRLFCRCYGASFIGGGGHRVWSCGVAVSNVRGTSNGLSEFFVGPELFATVVDPALPGGACLSQPRKRELREQ